MSKKIMLLALAAVTAAMFALPAVASAAEEDIPLHLNPTPTSTVVHGGESVLSTTGGTKVTCGSVTTEGSSVTFESGGTTGTMQLKFGTDCNAFGFTCNSSGLSGGEITTTSLPFHLVTVGTTSPGNPGVLVTPGATNHFATFTCGIIGVEVTGNGVVGTITSPECGKTSTVAKIAFKASANGVQEDKKVVGTATEYTLKKGTENAAMNATGEVTLNSASELICT